MTRIYIVSATAAALFIAGGGDPTTQIGLNGQRIHVKVGIPRKLYWADRLGLLNMADVPNSWGRLARVKDPVQISFEVEVDSITVGSR